MYLGVKSGTRDSEIRNPIVKVLLLASYEKQDILWAILPRNQTKLIPPPAPQGGDPDETADAQADLGLHCLLTSFGYILSWHVTYVVIIQLSVNAEINYNETYEHKLFLRNEEHRKHRETTKGQTSR